MKHQSLPSFFSMPKTTPFPTLSLLDWLIPVLVFFLLSRTPADADMWWHLRAGKEMWENQQILLTDTFSYTQAGNPWVNAFWLAEILLYGIYQLGGFLGLSLFVACMAALTFGVLYFRVRQQAPWSGALITLLAAITAAPVWGPRPQLFSFLLLTILDLLLAHPNHHLLRRVIMIGLLFALWANLHGGWIWGILLLIAHLAGHLFESLQTQSISRSTIFRLLQQSAILLTAGLAVGLNPNGLWLWRLPFHTVNVSMQIQEWLSPDFHRVDFHPMLWMLFLLLGSLNFGKERLQWAELFKIIGFVYLTFVAQRNIAPFAIVTAPVLARTTHSAFQTLGLYFLTAQPVRRPVNTIFNALLVLVLLGLALFRLHLLSTPALVEKDYPAKAVAWLKTQSFSGPLFNSYNWGGYLTWSLPEMPVYIDGRADLYGEAMLREWHAIVGGTPHGLTALEKRQIKVILLEPTWPVVRLLPTQGWSEVYRDETAVIFVR
ncbi:MAG: hypothetical protein DDG60_07605 [Anaerolineae bacterium]|nr:MAG: hypothetical protein DDG60_07605 [Anaerolineae bacterium]